MSTAQVIKLPPGVELWALAGGELRNLSVRDRREACLVAACEMHLARLSAARRCGLRVTRFAWPVEAPCFFCGRGCVEIRKRGARWSMLAVAPPPT